MDHQRSLAERCIDNSIVSRNGVRAVVDQSGFVSAHKTVYQEICMVTPSSKTPIPRAIYPSDWSLATAFFDAMSQELPRRTGIEALDGEKFELSGHKFGGGTWLAQKRSSPQKIRTIMHP